MVKKINFTAESVFLMTDEHLKLLDKPFSCMQRLQFSVDLNKAVMKVIHAGKGKELIEDLDNQ